MLETWFTFKPFANIVAVVQTLVVACQFDIESQSLILHIPLLSIVRKQPTDLYF